MDKTEAISYSARAEMRAQSLKDIKFPSRGKWHIQTNASKVTVLYVFHLFLRRFPCNGTATVLSASVRVFISQVDNEEGMKATSFIS